MYRERVSRLPGATVWTGVRGPGAPPTRILPDGCMDLIWSARGGLLVAGADTIATLADGPAGERYLGLRLAPGAGPAVFGVPAHELRDRRVPLADIWPGPVVRELTERIVRAGHPGRLLEEVAADQLRAQGGPAPLAAAVVDRLSLGHDVAATAVELGLGTRRLHRQCQALFGYGPKTLARILRMRRALALVATGVPAAEVAARTGYADQAHLSREVKSLAGVPLGALRK